MISSRKPRTLSTGNSKSTDQKNDKPGMKQKSISSFFFKATKTSSLNSSFNRSSQTEKRKELKTTRTSFSQEVISTSKSQIDLGKYKNNRPSLLFESHGSFDECDPDDEVKKLMDVPHLNNFKRPVLSRTPSYLQSPSKMEHKTIHLEDDSVREITSVSAGRRQLSFTSTQVNISETNSPTKAQPTKRSASLQGLKYMAPKKLKTYGHTLSTKSKSTPNITLTDEQQYVIDLVVKKRMNVFYTGSAGTGKSVILKKLVSSLQSMYGKECIAITASTGLAAATIGGITLHKWANVGIGNRPVDILVKKITRQRDSLLLWKNTKVLIVDEISMIDGAFLNKLEFIARALRKSDKPFGGIQLVLTGDFFQLPPVQKKDATQISIFCFESEMWKRCIQKTILLNKVFRQQDNELINILNCIRFGEIEPSMASTLYSLSREVTYSDGIVPTELYATRREVERSNSRQLSILPGNVEIFESQDTGARDLIPMLDSATMAERVLTLKQDAQVMMLKNKPDADLVNGTLGKVLFFTTERLRRKMFDLYPVIDDDTILDMRLVRQVIGNPVERHSQRFIQEINNRPLSGMDRLYEMINVATNERLEDKVYPFVRWSISKGKVYDELVLPDRFIVDLPGDRTGLEREQLPIMLCWALSIHKAQGQTIQRLKVDLSNIFEAGQVYVALSRAVSKENLQVLNFNPKKIKSNEKVKQFYKHLETVR